jgi:hypothetical protein
MVRCTFTAAAVLAAISFHVQPARAAVVYPWCAVISLGTGNVYWDCQYRSVEECVPNVLAGNRGFCNHNPSYVGELVPVRRHKVYRKHRVNRD